MPTVPLPRSLQVEVTGACNLRCHMCLVRYRPPLHRVKGSLTLDQFRSLVDELPDLDEITLQGLGEPLLAPDLMAIPGLSTSGYSAVPVQVLLSAPPCDKSDRPHCTRYFRA